MFTLFFRTLLIYILITIVIRLMGKRQVGELDMSELVTTLLLSQLASLPIEEPEIPLLYVVIPVFLIVATEIVISYLKGKFNFLKKIFETQPTLLICRGKIDQKEMMRMRITIEELLSEVRQQGYASLADIYYAIFEPNGKFSLLPKAEKAPLTPKDCKIKVSESGCSFPLICDGEIQEDNLKMVGRNEAWLQKICKEKKCPPSEVFLLTVDDEGTLCFVKKERSA